MPIDCINVMLDIHKKSDIRNNEINQNVHHVIHTNDVKESVRMFFILRYYLLQTHPISDTEMSTEPLTSKLLVSNPLLQ